MIIKKQRRSFAQTVKTGWNSVLVNHGPHARQLETTHMCEPAACRLFERTAEMDMTFSERFPCLTFAAIALALLAFILTAEIESMLRAGFYWR